MVVDAFAKGWNSTFGLPSRYLRSINEDPTSDKFLKPRFPLYYNYFPELAIPFPKGNKLYLTQKSRRKRKTPKRRRSRSHSRRRR